MENMDIWSHWVIQAVSFSVFWRFRFRNLSLGHRRIGTWRIIPGLVRSWDHPQIEAINFGHGWKGCLRTPGLGDVSRITMGPLTIEPSTGSPSSNWGVADATFFKASKVGWFSLRRKVAVLHLTSEIANSLGPAKFQVFPKSLEKGERIYQNFCQGTKSYYHRFFNGRNEIGRYITGVFPNPKISGVWFFATSSTS